MKQTAAPKKSDASKLLKIFNHEDDANEFAFSKASTYVFIKSLEGFGKNQAQKVKASHLNSIYTKQFIVDDLETYGKFSNDAEIIMPWTNLVFNMQDHDFNNSDNGKLICNSLTVNDVNVFTNKGHIETIDDINVNGRKISNCGEPIIEKIPFKELPGK